MSTFKTGFFIIVAALVFTSCTEEGCTDGNAINYNPEAGEDDGSCLYEKPQLTFNMEVTYGGEPMELDRAYNDHTGGTITFSDCKFYLSDITVTATDETTYNLSEVNLFNYDDDENNVWTPAKTFEAPVAEIKSISFGLGVKESLNTTDPNSKEADHPLSIYPEMYWTWASKYRFTLIEGRYNNDPDPESDGSFFYHTGLDKFYQNVGPLSVSAQTGFGQNDEITISLDLQEVFYHPQDTLEYTSNAEGQTHTEPGKEAIAERFLVNIARSFKVKDGS